MRHAPPKSTADIVTETKTEVTWKLRGAPFLSQDAAGWAITPVQLRYVTFSGTDKTKPRSYVEAVGPAGRMPNGRIEYRSKKWRVNGALSQHPHISQAPAWIRELVGYSD